LAPQRSPSHTVRSLSADSHTPLPAMVCFHGCSIVPRPYYVRLLLELPSAQSPFARARCYLARRGLLDHVSRCYPAVIAPTDSCASPQPSSCLGGTLGHQVCAGCGQPLLGGGPSRCYLCASVSACLDLYPGGSRGAFTRFFPQDNGLPNVRNRSALNNPHTLATSVGRPISRLQSCAHLQARRLARHPGCSYRSP